MPFGIVVGVPTKESGVTGTYLIYQFLCYIKRKMFVQTIVVYKLPIVPLIEGTVKLNAVEQIFCFINR